MVTPATDKEIQAVCNDPNYVTYCSLADRIGLRSWMTEIEYTKFRPGTLLNDDFHLVVMKWPDDVPLHWLMIIFHVSEQQFAESILWKNGLRKTEEGTYPIIFGGSKMVDISDLREKGSIEFKVVPPEPNWEEFPFKGYGIHLLENHSKGAANVMYSSNPDKMKAARELEEAQCQVFFDEQNRWLETPEAVVAMEEYMKAHPDGHNI